MKRLFVVISLLALFVSALSAQSAKVTYVKGKVEVSSGNGWVALKVGDTVSQSQTISTGFQSEARLNLNGHILAVAAFTRVKLETLAFSEKNDSVNLYVDTGAVRSQVNKTQNKKIDYTARTAVAVASVRGTTFDLFASGRARCSKGGIAYYAAKKYNRNRSAGKRDKVAAADEKEANANTSADKIDDRAPRGAVVLGAGQESKLDHKGEPERPMKHAKSESKKKKTRVKTAKEKDIILAGGDIGDERTSLIEPQIIITIRIPEQ